MEEARAQAAIETLNRQILSVGEGAAPLTPDGLDRLRVLLEVHASELRSARAGSMALRGIAARPTAAVAAHLVNGPGPLALSRLAALLPISDDEGADRGPDEATATDYAQGVAAMAGWEASVGPDSRLRGTIQKSMAAITRTCRDRIDSHMQPNTDADIPDVRLLARAILRIHRDADEWARYTSVGDDPVLHVELAKRNQLLLCAPLCANAPLCVSRPVLVTPAINTFM